MKKAILLALLLSGCSDYYEHQNEARWAGYQERCTAAGFAPATQPFANCTLSLDQQDTNNRQALIGAYLANQPHPQPYVLPMPAAPVQAAPRSCISTVAGQTVFTNCN